MNSPFVNIHTHRPTSRGIELRTAGIHPWDAERSDPTALECPSDEIQAIGEIGLDRVCDATFERQLALFRAQLSQAVGLDLPVVIHCVKAFGEVMRELRACTPRAVIFHGFIGSTEQAREAVSRGYYLSFGERTFASPRTRDALLETPLSHLFVESDQSPTPIEAIYARIAAARATTTDELRRATHANYKRIFDHE